MKIIYISILYAQLCLTFDIELEGVIRMGDEFLESLNKDVQEYHSVQKELKDKNKSVDYRKSDKVREPALPVINKDKFYAVAIYLQQNGYERLKALDKTINDKLGIKANLNSYSEKASRKLNAEIFNYVNETLQRNLTNVIDREFMVIDLIETSNKLLHSALKDLLAVITSLYKVRYLKNMKQVSDNIHKDVVSEKKDNFWYICNKFSICRPYPAFSDFFGDLMVVIIKTNLTDFKQLFTTVKKVLEAKYAFIENMIHASIYKEVVEKVNTLVNEPVNLRNLLLYLRSVIIKRHKLIDTEVEIFKIKAKAVKIIIDIFDRAFDSDGFEIVELNLNVVIDGLEAWKMRQRSDFQRIVILFVNYVLDTLKSNLTPYILEEIKTLTEVIWNESFDAPNRLVHPLVPVADLQQQQSYQPTKRWSTAALARSAATLVARDAIQGAGRTLRVLAEYRASGKYRPVDEPMCVRPADFVLVCETSSISHGDARL
ncbi:hypothetical protein K1T71_012367 [Dendrolimus kikuchii]|uniref:Uncharacterized protein n=1 Tax=Dendrolimus kikuchii TaxID=765133 RepID=A0ACC1CLC4_9NEOP|nr:hypothetical protein K1T71_012367 [Dendrolimus kikuchii]